ncbi:hypothetical protein ACIBH1_02520 [Nonomuraea sp. NPDC050663]|uniref:hypothetical protein n=1 Tax=Nonomuraea sp. NPDC050663 TaxID=3364370 RepID=UPI00379B94AB
MIVLNRSVPPGAVIVLSGTAQPYGSIEVTVAKRPRVATLECPGLPRAVLSHPDTSREGRVPLDERTTLTVGELRAVVTQGRGLAKKDRALKISMGGRDYTYLATGANVEELAGLVRSHAPLGSTTTVTVSPEAGPYEVALALILLGADTNPLTLTRSAISGVVGFLQTGQGEA